MVNVLGMWTLGLWREVDRLHGDTACNISSSLRTAIDFGLFCMKWKLGLIWFTPTLPLSQFVEKQRELWEREI